MIKELFDLGFIVIHSGGGGIPVVRGEDGELHGVEAVVDKDLTASIIASILKVDIFLILTDVERVVLNAGKPNEEPLYSMTSADCEMYSKQGQFPPGSMGPKIESARRFVVSSGGKAVITSLGRALDALSSKSGTCHCKMTWESSDMSERVLTTTMFSMFQICWQ